MADSGGQKAEVLISGGGTCGTTPTVEHPDIIVAPNAISNIRGPTRRFSFVKLTAQVLVMDICLLLILGHSLNQLIFEFNGSRPFLISFTHGVRKPPRDLPLVNPLCDSVINGGAAPGQEHRNHDRRVEQEFEKVRHWLSSHLSEALRLDAPVQNDSTEDDSEETEGEEDFVRAQGEHLLGHTYPSLCLDGYGVKGLE
jgi:hypothetical protein